MVWFILFCITAIAGLFYYWFTSDYEYFEKSDVPGPKPKFPWGNMPSIITRKRNITYDYNDIYQAYRGKAPFVGYFELKSPSYLLIDPETIKSIMIKNFKNFKNNIFGNTISKEKDPIFARNPFFLRDDEWKEKRAEITPAFTPSRIKALLPLVDEILQRFSNYINDQLKKDNKEPLDAREISSKFTIDVVSSCGFNADAQSFTKEKSEIREMGRNIFQFSPWLIFVTVVTSIFPIISKFYKPKIVQKYIEDFFSNLMFQAVQHREKDQISRGDYLDYLIALRKKKNISELDMASHGVSFFLDGFETSAGAITNELFELASNKNVQNKLRDEIKDIYDADGKMVYEKLMDNEYLDQVIHEALRLHPPLLVTNRVCSEAIDIEGVKGKMHRVKVGDSIMIPIYSIHRDPEYYSEPEKFMPERFNPEHGGLKAFKDRGVFIPFGDGPRICLGMRFTLMMSKSAIAHLVKNFEITVYNKTKLPFVIDPSEFIAHNTGGVWLNFKPIDLLLNFLLKARSSAMIWFILFCVAAIAGLIYYWLTAQHKHFEKVGVPGPKAKFPLGNIPSLITQSRNMTYDYDDIYQEFRGKAPFVGYFEFKSPSIMVIDPETIKTVLIKNFKNFHDSSFSQMTDKEKDPIFGRNPFMLRGEEWKEKRAEITPAFSPSRIKALFPLVDEILQRFSNYINDQLKKDNKEPLAAREICAKYTTDVVSSCIFNADAQSFTKEKPEIREMGRSIMQPSGFITFMFIIYAIFPSMMKIFKVKMVKKEVEDFFTNLMQQAIEHRDKSQTKRDDYLAYLIELRNKKNLSELDMAAHGVTFFIDGFETSSGAIMHSLFELAANKNVQDKLRDEIKEMFDNNGKIIYEKLIDNEYLDQVFHEALRLHPPATLTNRECTEAIELDGVKDKKYQVKVGDSIMIPIYSIHRDPEYYSEPEKFMPERFNPEHGGLKAFKDKGVYLAFGDGPRICIGMRFALMQSKAAIAHLVRNFEITVNDKTKQPLTIDPKEFLNIKTGGIWLDFKPIN